MNPKASLIFLLLPALSPTLFAAEESTSYVGRAACAECHPKQLEQWTGSHHDLAMQPATADTVLGDFDDSVLTWRGVTSTFYRDGERFMVRTEGPDGKLQEYEIQYTFGVTPLQQYLIEFPGGRLQALSLAWDSRPKEQSGQRWFHLYPGETIAYDDELHWTKPSQNWNNMCAECHSTRLRRNYDPATRTFATTWFEIDVSCEACHGPGAEHIAWAKKEPGWEEREQDMGLALLLDERKGVQWQFDPQTGYPVRSQPRTTEREIQMCARCHARRSPLTDGYRHGGAFLDYYRPQLLNEGMYFADGQIQDEVYVYGSFLQSKMYATGVTCSDCHDPHSMEPKLPGNTLCVQCHAAGNYASPEHHHHKPEQPGGSCVECHMPPRNYMVVDPRHDHSMRIPRPDLSLQLGTPNACNNCHSDKEPQWAADHFKKWYPDRPQGHQGYAETLAAARNGHPRAGQMLATLIRNDQAPAIVRATALSAIAGYLSRDNLDTLLLGSKDADPLVRTAAVEAAEPLPPRLRVELAFPLLQDPVRTVRSAAAMILADLAPGELPEEQRKALEQATQEYIQAQQANAERAEAQTNLGNLYVSQGKNAAAAAAYGTAIELNPAFTPAYVNLADLRRNQGDEAAAEQTLRQALAAVPGDAAARYALGLSLVRQKRHQEAVAELRLTTEAAPDNAGYVYVYAVALDSTGKPEQAVLVLQGAHNRFPENADILNALVSFHRKLGNEEAAAAYIEKLREL